MSPSCSIDWPSLQNSPKRKQTRITRTMESHPVVPDRKLLVRLVLIREEARNMMAGGILDERNDHGLNILPKSEVRDELEQLLDDYDDMEDLYLSRKLAGA